MEEQGKRHSQTETLEWWWKEKIRKRMRIVIFDAVRMGHSKAETQVGGVCISTPLLFVFSVHIHGKH
jgi:hypothetical protein